MEYTSRLVIAAFVGGWIGYGVSLMFGDPIYWVLLFSTIMIATDSATRMMHVRKRSQSSSAIAPDTDKKMLKAERREKAPDPHF